MKASFCMEDTVCKRGIKPIYTDCDSKQGIQPGCSDTYGNKLDCQWVDITHLPPGIYKFRAVVNPTMEIRESSYRNNAVDCKLTYENDSRGKRAILSNCVVGPLKPSNN